jgi:predicted nucleic acid-binding protein
MFQDSRPRSEEASSRFTIPGRLIPAEKAIELRTSMNISLPDAVIAAPALSPDAMLVTRNEHDFARVPWLKVLNPFRNGE